jgi:Ca2+-binding RTX toxin-like protein
MQGEGSDTVITTISYALPTGSSIEILRTMGSSTSYAVDLTGNEFANTLIGNAAANMLDGRGGADVMWGYGGNDTYLVDNPDDVVMERGGEGFDTIIVDSLASYALAAGSEVELLSTRGSATTFAINLTGNEFNNMIVGNAATNVLDGRGGADAMWGYGGDDLYYVDNPNDVVVEFAGDGYDTVYTNVSFTLAPGSAVEELRTMGSSTTSAIDLTGNELDNIIVGNAAANVINGGAGADVMWGYGGNDVYYVDNEKDVVVEQPGNGFDTIYASANFTLTPGNEVEQLLTPGSVTTYAINLTGNELANTIVGNDGVNVLDGGAGDDLIWGYAGNDVLIGGLGKDVLNGGDGADRFVYLQVGESLTGAATRDVIHDFTPGVDKIDLSALQIPQLHFAGSAPLESFGVTFGWSDGATLVDIDVNGDRSSDMQIELTGQLQLSANDFVFA